jgi:hypothetical protein
MAGTEQKVRWALAALSWLAFAAAGGAVVSQAVTLVSHAAAGTSDIGVLHRTAVDLNAGGAEDVYAGRPKNGWQRSIPPFGMLPFRLLACFGPTAAGVIWAGVNLLLLAAGIACLAAICRRLECRREAFSGTLVWAAAMLLVLATGSIQTGQFSILFVVCWLAYLLADSRRMPLAGGLALAAPAAVKFYPALLAAVPASLRRYRQILYFCLGFVLFSGGVVLAAYGRRAWPLTVSYVRENLLASDNLVTLRLAPETVSNQALDVVLQRYLTHDAGFHGRHPEVPHLRLPRSGVLALAVAIRVAVLATAVVVTRRWVRAARRTPRYAALMMAALWAATLYLILPEAKARYAVYTFPAFVPVIAAGADAFAAWRLRRVAGVMGLAVLCGFCVMGYPHALRPFGWGLLGSALLWVSVLVCLRAPCAGDAGPAGEEPA